ncbi:MAG: hypothetical protein U0271_18950 [Polyangiaceae bacterium]
MIRSKSVLQWLVAPMFLFGCSSSKSEGGGRQIDPNICAAAPASAKARFAPVTAASENFVCNVDADCSSVPIVGSCFDSCSMSMNTRGRLALDRIIAVSEAVECRDFVEKKCAVEHPPCAPPGPPRCEEHVCR